MVDLRWGVVPFQSTHPIGSTICVAYNFNPRTPGGVRRHRQRAGGVCGKISIHAPRVGCDGYYAPAASRYCISIHAPRVGCDRTNCTAIGRKSKISIHAPRVGCDTDTTEDAKPSLEFQSTHPGWGATTELDGITSAVGISIHAPRVGCDQ